MPVAVNSIIRTVEVGVVPKRRTSEACSAAYGTTRTSLSRALKSASGT